MNVIMRLSCIRPQSDKSQVCENAYEMSADFAALPRPGDQIVLPLEKDESRHDDQPLEFSVVGVSWEVAEGKANPVLEFRVESEWGDETNWMKKRGWVHKGFRRHKV